MSARPSLMAVTVYQPWAFLLAAGYKPLENRDWRPTNTVPLGSRMAIHAGMKFDPGEVKAIVDELQDTGVLKVRPEDRPLTLAMLGAQCGHILSVGRLAGIVTQSESPYFVGKYATCVSRGNARFSTRRRRGCSTKSRIAARRVSGPSARRCCHDSERSTRRWRFPQPMLRRATW